MEKIYLPSDYVNSPCKIINNGYIRAYTNNNLTNYVDIYINQDYMIKSGTTTYGYNGVCDNMNTYTDDIWYRLDFFNIIITYYVFILLLCIPFKLIYRFFKIGRRF